MSSVRLDAGLLALTDPDLHGKVIFSVPPPQFPHKIPAGRRLSGSPEAAPGDRSITDPDQQAQALVSVAEALTERDSNAARRSTQLSAAHH